jgi:diguanylate cyclase (GGDEF)-like protein
MNHEQKLKGILSELQLNEDSLRRRLAHLKFSDEDREQLAKLSVWFEREKQTVMREMTSDFSLVLDSVAVSTISVSDIEINTLNTLLSQYINGLLSGCYNEKYFEKRVELGMLHQERGVAPARYTGVMYQWEERIIDAYCRDPDNGIDFAGITRALHKIVLFDITLVLESYAHAEHQSIEYVATHDVLTGLVNRHQISETVDLLLAQCDESHPISLLFIGISRFKAVNETLGHNVGDAVLKEIARRLTDHLPVHDFAGRLGGDLFVCVAPSCSEEATLQLGEKLIAVLNRPLRLEGLSVDVCVTIGAAIASSPETTSSTLLSQAEMALYHAKGRRQNLAMYADMMKRYSVTQLGIGAELERAMSANELLLFYQPKIDLMKRRIVGAEALIRWLHPFNGMVPPGKFIPAAEDSIIIHPLTDWILDAALTRVAQWWKQGLNWVMSINLSAANLHNQELAGRLAELISLHGVDPNSVMLEITESSLMTDPVKALDTVNALKKLGVKLSIDDFGTGYSSLAYLKDLPVDEVKVDQTFVFGMGDNDKDARIVRGTINLGHSLGLSVAAEGVENEETIVQLKELGCDTAQGYHIARPMPDDEFIVWAEGSGFR